MTAQTGKDRDLLVTNADEVKEVFAKINSQIEIYFKGEFLKAGLEDRLPHEGILYHYTTAQGLEGILRNREIFATHSDYLNDISELHHGKSLVLKRFSEKALADYFQEPRDKIDLLTKSRRTLLTDDEMIPLMNIVMAAVRQHFASELEFGCFVTSFCKQGNLLSQWRGYGGAGGYSIGFRFPNREIQYENNQKRTALLHGLIYQKTKQTAMLDFVLPALENVITLIRPSEGFLSNAGDDPRIINLGRRLCACLGVYCLRMKHSSFKSEQEMRLTTTRQYHKDYFDADDLHFRQAGALNIPYVKIPLQDRNAEVVSVRCGPTLPRAKAIKSVKMMLKQFGYKDVRVTSSAIPLGW